MDNKVNIHNNKEQKQSHQEDNQSPSANTPKEKKEFLSRLSPIQKIAAFAGTAIAAIIPIYNTTTHANADNSNNETVSNIKTQPQKQTMLQQVTPPQIASKRYTAEESLQNQRIKKYKNISIQILDSIINKDGMVSFTYVKNKNEVENFLKQETLDTLKNLLGDQTGTFLNFLQILNSGSNELSLDQLLSIITELSQTDKDILQGGFTLAFETFNFNSSDIHKLLSTARNISKEQLFILSHISSSAEGEYLTDAHSFISFFNYIAQENRLNYNNYELIGDMLDNSKFSPDKNLVDQTKNILKEVKTTSVDPENQNLTRKKLT
jgi:hypothetical protein